GAWRTQMTGAAPERCRHRSWLALWRGRRGRLRRRRRALGLRRRRRLELAARHARQQWQGLAAVEVLLLIHHVVVLEVGLERRLRRVAQDLRADEQDEVVLGRGGVARLEQQPDERNVAEVGHALLTLDAVVLDQPAEHHHAAVLDEHRGGDGALVGDQVDRAGGLLTDARALDRDLEHHRRPFSGDGGRHLEDGADFLALNRLERIDAATGDRRGVGEL